MSWLSRMKGSVTRYSYSTWVKWLDNLSLLLDANVLLITRGSNLLCYTATRCLIVCHKCKRSVDNFNEECMMAWPNKHDKPVQQNWQSRFARKRVDLSKSVEEALADSTLAEEILSDELDEEDEPVQGEKNSMIIPPKLSLQSRPLPVVRGEPKETTSVVVADPRATTTPFEVSHPAPQKHRLAGRTTKARLQALSKPENKSNGKT